MTLHELLAHESSVLKSRRWLTYELSRDRAKSMNYLFYSRGGAPVSDIVIDLIDVALWEDSIDYDFV